MGKVASSWVAREEQRKILIGTGKYRSSRFNGRTFLLNEFAWLIFESYTSPNYPLAALDSMTNFACIWTVLCSTCSWDISWYGNINFSGSPTCPVHGSTFLGWSVVTSRTWQFSWLHCLGWSQVFPFSFLDVAAVALHLGCFVVGWPQRRAATAMLSSRGMYPDSSRAVKGKAKLPKSFQLLKGAPWFWGCEPPSVRGFKGGKVRSQMSPVYPIEVAMELGNIAMVQLLLEAGAIYPTMEWKTWICSWLGTKDGLGARRSHRITASLAIWPWRSATERVSCLRARRICFRW